MNVLQTQDAIYLLPRSPWPWRRIHGSIGSAAHTRYNASNQYIVLGGYIHNGIENGNRRSGGGKWDGEGKMEK
jgi:hypothetical protein